MSSVHLNTFVWVNSTVLPAMVNVDYVGLCLRLEIYQSLGRDLSGRHLSAVPGYSGNLYLGYLPILAAYTIPYLYHTIPIPCHTIPYHTVSYHTIPYHTILIPWTWFFSYWQPIPYHTIPYLYHGYPPILAAPNRGYRNRPWTRRADTD